MVFCLMNMSLPKMLLYLVLLETKALAWSGLPLYTERPQPMILTTGRELAMQQQNTLEDTDGVRSLLTTPMSPLTTTIEPEGGGHEVESAMFSKDVKAGFLEGVLLQGGEWASSYSYVDSGFGALPNLTEVTVCVRFRLLHGGQPATIFSYYDGIAFEQLNVAIKYPDEEMLVMCCAYHVHQYVKIPVKLFVWHHVCVALNIPNDTLKIIFDDTVINNQAKRNETDSTPGEARIVGGGRFVLGQNVNLDAEWDVTQSVHGELVDFRLYDQDLPVDVMRTFTTCKKDTIPIKPLFKFGDTGSNLEVKGEVISVELSEICRITQGHVILFPERMVFDDALNRCRYLRGELAVPRDDDENTRLFDRFIPFNDQCIQGWNALYWMGLESDIPTESWTYMADGKPLGYTSWLEGWSIPSDQYPCSVAAAINFPYLWYNAECNTLTCPACNFTETPELRMRGLCRESKFDRDYYISGYHNGRPKFEGMYFSQIIWNNVTWVLRTRKERDVEAQMIEERPKGYPLGLATWKIKGDSCGYLQSEYLLTPCGKDDFTCSDGSCILLLKRCDQVTDCPDNSDELNCDIVKTPLGYTPDLPPPSFENLPVLLTMAIEITSVREFDLVGFSMQLDIIQSITWRDARLTLTNLRSGDFNNQAEVDEKIWRPEVAIQDGSRSPTDITMRTQLIRVNKEGNPMPDVDTRIREDKLFAGADNTMKILQQYTVRFICQFSLKMYPFDIQKCLLSYNISNIQQNFVFKKGGIIFSGKRRLLEYECVKEEMLNREGDPGVIDVVMTFRNQYGYYIGNAVVPSLFMVSICYLTLLFDLNDFQDRIMVSLTSLLVLAALFSQTSQSIPKTAYLKLIDVWYIGLITVDFLIIVVLVLIENLRLRASFLQPMKKMFIRVSPPADDTQLKKAMNHAEGDDEKPKDFYLQASIKLNSFSLIVFPVSCFLFCLVFFVIGFY